MLKLINLELKRNNIKVYILSVFIAFAALLGFTYLFAYVPHKQARNSLEAMLMEAVSFMFSTYDSIISLTCIISVSIFTILSAVMYTQFVVEDYKGKQVYLLFSYPVNRSKIFLSKVIVVFSFTVLSMNLCNAAVFYVFYLTESISPLVVTDTFSMQTVAEAAKSTIIFSLLAGALGVISMKVGFIKKSIPATIIASVIFVTFMSNVLSVPILIGSTLGNNILILACLIIALCVSIFFVIELMRKVNRMEVE